MTTGDVDDAGSSAPARSRAGPGVGVDHGPPQVLADDEVTVLRLMADGLTVEAVARRLGVSERTVRRKVRSACASVGVDTTVEAIVWAVRHRLI